MRPDRRSLLAGAASFAAAPLTVAPLAAQPRPAPDAARPAAAQTPRRFSFDEVVRRARDLSAAPFDEQIAAMPEGLESLDFDAWREIRFRNEKAIQVGLFRLHLFHLGHLFKRPVTINTIRDGIATPIPYSAGLFDYGKSKPARPLPVNTGFAGFRALFPLNRPNVWDEFCSFVGASYFRFLGRDQAWGLSARALSIGAGHSGEEFPFFREFWIEQGEGRPDQLAVYGLLDSSSVTGAFQIVFEPGVDAIAVVRGALFPRRVGVRLALAPLTSMFYRGANGRRPADEFRYELHDSDGLLIENANGEWMWRPLANPERQPLISQFVGANPRGFGLMQRNRNFLAYQDLDLAYQLRPSYWVEPTSNWGDGAVELAEMPTTDETNDNIVASFVLANPPAPGAPFEYSYNIYSTLDMARLSPGGRVVNTFETMARALGSAEVAPAGSRRFLVDFSGGELAYFSRDPGQVEAVASISRGKVLRAYVVANPNIQGLRAAVDVEVAPGETGDVRLFLRARGAALTETWTCLWSPPPAEPPAGGSRP